METNRGKSNLCSGSSLDLENNTITASCPTRQLDYKDQVRAARSRQDADAREPQHKSDLSFLGRSHGVPFARAELVTAEELLVPSSFECSTVSIPTPPATSCRPRYIRAGIIITLLSILMGSLAVIIGTNCTASGCFQSTRIRLPGPITRTDPQHTYSNWTEILPHDLMDEDGFGGSVAVYEDLIVVGAYLKDDNGLRKPGSAYVFRKSSSGVWAEEQKLQPGTLVENSRFGRSVAVHGSMIVVGAYLDDHAGLYSGSAYVFRLENGLWIEEQKLVPNNATADSLFGISVAIHEDRIFVGAPNENNRTGSAFVFSRDHATGQWTQQQKLVAFDASPGDKFGASLDVDLHGKTVVVGAEVAGGAHVFVKAIDGWFVELEKLRSNVLSPSDVVARSVGVSGGTVAIGARGGQDGSAPENSGSVYLFRVGMDGWIDYQLLQLPNATENARFGSDLAISRDRLVVASRYGNEGESATIHVYSRVGEDEWEKLFDLDETLDQNDFRRISLAMDGNVLVAGSTYGTTTLGDETGAVHVFEF